MTLHDPTLFIPSTPFPPGIEPLNLSGDGVVTAWIPTARHFSMIADIQIRTGKAWANAIVGMQWSIANDAYANPVTFSPTVVFNSSTKSISNINIASLVWVRFIVTTPGSGDDEAAQVLYMVE